MNVYGPTLPIVSGAVSAVSGVTHSSSPNAPGTPDGVLLNASSTEIEQVYIVYTDDSVVGAMGHTAMMFRCRRSQDSREHVFMCSYAANLSNARSAARSEGIVIAASPELFFNADESVFSLYGDAQYELFELNLELYQRREFLWFWMDMMVRTPSYTLFFNNCATVIRDQLRRVLYRWEHLHRPHDWGGTAPAPYSFARALEVEFRQYSSRYSAVASYVRMLTRSGAHISAPQSRTVQHPPRVAPSMHGHFRHERRRSSR